MPANDDYEQLSGMAERLKLEDDERDNFVNSGMARLGYKPKQLQGPEAWDEPEAEGDGDEGDKGDFFAARKKQQQQREQRPVNDRSGNEPPKQRFGY